MEAGLFKQLSQNLSMFKQMEIEIFEDKCVKFKDQRVQIIDLNEDNKSTAINFKFVLSAPPKLQNKLSLFLAQKSDQQIYQKITAAFPAGQVFLGTYYGFLHVLDPKQLRLVSSKKVHGNAINRIRVNDRMIITASRDTTCMVRQRSSLECLYLIKDVQQLSTSMDLCQWINDNYFTTCQQQVIKVWRIDQIKLQKRRRRISRPQQRLVEYRRVKAIQSNQKHFCYLLQLQILVICNLKYQARILIEQVFRFSLGLIPKIFFIKQGGLCYQDENGIMQFDFQQMAASKVGQRAKGVSGTWHKGKLLWIE